MKVLITGAHFTPAQAVIEELLGSQKLESRIKNHDPLSLALSHEGREDQTVGQDSERDVEIVYVGRGSTREGDSSPSVESRVLPGLGVRFVPIIAGRVRRYFSLGTIFSLLKIPVGFVQSFFILLREQPDVVLSFGGYVAVPVVFNAWLLNIPIIVHEQTLVSGLANTFSTWFADRIAVSFEQKYSFDSSKLLVTGNPMRKQILDPVVKGAKEIEGVIGEARKQKKPLILITGGNQGSHSINLAVEEVLDQLVKDYIVVHQTGDSSFDDYERLESSRKSLESSDNYLVKKWISEEDMGRLFSEIDLAVSRCGANTLLELSYHQVPTLMIPLPSVTHDEQTKNARFFAAHGLGTVLLQKNLSGKSLIHEVKLMINDKFAKVNALKARDVVILDAEKKLAQEILLMDYVV